MTKILNRKSYNPGDIIIRQGEEGNCAFFIESGRLEVLIKDESGNTTAISELPAGTVFGEMALIGDHIRSATVRAIEPCIITKISEKDFKQNLKKTHRIFQAILDIMVNRLKRTNRLLAKTSTNLKELEEKINFTVKNVSSNMGEKERDAFEKEISPLLDRLKVTLQKYM